ncbi:MAG: hypothetical protein KF764_02895 [Labilithrix sp.]|nr:hypothetical protein [Labilithrix sp.]
MASKFEELCSAYKTTRRNFFDYQDEATDFLKRAANQLATEWGLPSLRLVPLHKPVKEGTTYNASGAVHVDFATGTTTFHMGVSMTVYVDPQTHPQDNVVLRLSARREKGEWFLGCGGAQLKSVGSGKDPDRIRPVLDEFFKKLLADYPTDPESIGHQASAAEGRQIGFAYAPEESAGR